ncbi:unnamed protein product [Phyllotreta striolata]|uniref:Epidermal cell surface receptor n=1 Tax=Phyllotreta striolata TaxID=444603 RepID=A0A9P0DZG3_PHYSR|nr:unnamed protein product [Phyllotreta striolata]
MTRRSPVVFVGLVAVLVYGVRTENCPPGSTGGNCASTSSYDNDVYQPRTMQDLTAHTSKPPERPQAMSMLAEDSDMGFQPTPLPSVEPLFPETSTASNEISDKNATGPVEEPKGRALNFTMSKHDGENVLHNASSIDTDLSDVTINDDDNFDMDVVQPKILAPKTELKNVSNAGACQQGGLTYEHGYKIENGCDSICTCLNGTMNCTDRCAQPFIRKGKKINDPLCFAQSTDDMCCSVLVCAGDTETEPTEHCSYKNETFNRGDIYKEGCSEICTCESGGNMSCKPRCPPVTKPNDRCVEVPDTSDTCCKKMLCDVTLEDNESEKEDEKVRRVTSARYVNSTAVSLKFDPSIDPQESSVVVEVSDDKTNWIKHKVMGGFVTLENPARYLKLENSDEITNIQNFEGNPKESVKDKSSATGCKYKDKFFNIGDEYNDDCESLCVCEIDGMKCLKMQCPTYFGVDIIDPNCIEWETVPLDFVPKPPRCCPSSVKCKNNGSCDYEGVVYKNWEQLPINVTGCEKRCYCEMGKVECQNACPPVTAHPPPNLPCPPSMARIDHLPDDDCCKYWVCGHNDQNQVTDDNVADKDKKNITKTPYNGPFSSKPPSKTLGPLAVYENEPSKISSQENPFYHNISNNNNSGKKPSIKSKNKKPAIFVTQPNLAVETTSSAPEVHSEIEIHGHGNPEELLQFINRHPELSNYPSGSVLEIHDFPAASKPAPNSISNADKSNIHLVPYVIPQGGHNENLPPGLSLEHILNEFHKNSLPNGQVFSNIPHVDRPFLGQQNIPLPSKINVSRPGINGFPGQFPGYQQPDDDILVHTLEAIDPHTVRLAFMVPPVIVNLHGRVEVRYTNKKNDDDLDSWMLQVFAPPNDLIATPSLEFDLQDLQPNTEYKIKITITLRDIHTTHSSRIYKIKTPREATPTTTLPPMIPIEPDLAITDINSTWVTVVWRKFDDNELRFIDGVQLRYREIDGKIYAATPLIYRAVTSYTLEKLKPNTKYEIGIFFIPFPGQLTELHAEHMLHFTTANEVDTYGFNVTLEISSIKSQSVEIIWNGVPYPEDKYVNIYRAIYQSDSGKEDESLFKIAKRDSPTKTIIKNLKPGTRYRLWLEVYLTNGKIKTSNVQDFITKPRTVPVLGASTQQDKLARAEHLESKGDYYGPLVIVAILAAIAIMSTLVLLLILIRRHNQNKAAITPPSRVSQSAYDNPTYKVEIQQETMGL